MSKLKIKKLTGFLKFFLSKNVIGITLAPFDEKIHGKQQIEMGIIFFYIWYLLEWFFKLFKYGKQAYRNISFEREAYDNDMDFDYISQRKTFAWVDYISKK
jgi:hypothetical protein